LHLVGEWGLVVSAAFRAAGASVVTFGGSQQQAFGATGDRLESGHPQLGAGLEETPGARHVRLAEALEEPMDR